MGRGCSPEIGWVQRSFGKPIDSNAEFDQVMQQVRADRAAGRNPLNPKARDFTFLFAGGLFSGLGPTELYFGPNMEALEEYGVTAHRLPMASDWGQAKNAEIVREGVAKEAAATGKRVVLVGHSAGGNQAGAALMLYPEVHNQTRALITLNTPWGGAPETTDIVNIPGFKPVAGSFLLDKVLHGDVSCAVDLEYGWRQQFLTQNAFPKDIPAVCLASTRFSPLSMFFTGSAYIRARYSAASDGLVVPTDAFIPGSKGVTVDNMDHLQAAFRKLDPLQPYTAEELTLALANMAMDTKDPRPSQ